MEAAPAVSQQEKEAVTSEKPAARSIASRVSFENSDDTQETGERERGSSALRTCHFIAATVDTSEDTQVSKPPPAARDDRQALRCHSVGEAAKGCDIRIREAPDVTEDAQAWPSRPSFQELLGMLAAAHESELRVAQGGLEPLQSKKLKPGNDTACRRAGSKSRTSPHLLAMQKDAEAAALCRSRSKPSTEAFPPISPTPPIGICQRAVEEAALCRTLSPKPSIEVCPRPISPKPSIEMCPRPMPDKKQSVITPHAAPLAPKSPMAPSEKPPDLPLVGLGMSEGNALKLEEDLPGIPSVLDVPTRIVSGMSGRDVLDIPTRIVSDMSGKDYDLGSSMGFSVASASEAEPGKDEFLLRKWWGAALSKGVERKISFSRRSTGIVLVQKARQTTQNLIVTSVSPLQCLVVHPSSVKRMVWDIMSMTLLAYDIMVIPFVGAFTPPSMPFLICMTWGTLLFWTLDMPLAMFSGYVEGKYTIMAPSRILQHYARTWFCLDAIIVGFDWASMVVESEGAEGSDGSAARLGRTLRTLRFIRTLRLIRIFKLKKMVQAVQDSINTEAVSIMFGVFKIIIGLIVANHIVACGWYQVGMLSDEDGGISWLRTADMGSRSLVYRYFTSLHWSLTQFTPASMEVVPQSTGERIYTVNVILFAMIAFSSFVSLLTASMAQLQALGSNESRQFWLLRRYLRDWGVRRATANKVQRYLDYAYQKQRQRVQDCDVKLLAMLSETLRLELKHETFSQYLAGHPLFQIICEQSRIFGKSLQASHWAIQDVLFVAGQQCEKIVFLTSGALEYTLGIGADVPLEGNAKVHSHSMPREEVWEGQWVAEAGLWTNWSHQGDLITMTECQVITVKAEEFGEAVQMNAQTWFAVRKYAERFVASLNEVDLEDITDLGHQLFKPEECIDKDDFFFLERIEEGGAESRFGRMVGQIKDTWEELRGWAKRGDRAQVGTFNPISP